MGSKYAVYIFAIVGLAAMFSGTRGEYCKFDIVDLVSNPCDTYYGNGGQIHLIYSMPVQYSNTHKLHILCCRGKEYNKYIGMTEICQCVF